MQVLRRLKLHSQHAPTVAAFKCSLPVPGCLPHLGSSRAVHHVAQHHHALVKQLLRNDELDEDDARAELRWMIDEARRSCVAGDARGAEVDVAIRDMVDRRSKGEPLQYILGTVDFGPLDLLCRPPTLIPRPETADITTRFANLLPLTPLNGLDLCTGSGCIPLLLTHIRSDLSFTGVDISKQAIDLARDNAERCNLHDRAVFQLADVMGDTTALGRYDVITSNPPYITTAEYAVLPSSVKQYEDPRALLGSLGEADDGLTFYRRIAHILPNLLSPGSSDWPCVMLEIGAEQGEAVKDIIQGVQCLGRVQIWHDLYGKHRAVVAWRA